MNAIAGAAILAQRFAASAQKCAAEQPPTPDASALPIFHWIRVEPAAPQCPQAESSDS